MPTALLWFDGPNFDPQTKVWSDTSGNDYHTRNPYGSNFGPHNQNPSGTPTVDTHSNGLQYVVFKSDAWLAVPHSMFVRTMSAVIMAPDGQTSWSSFGSYLNRVSSRQCNFLFSSGTDKLYSDQYPTRAWRNGASLSSPYHHGPINNWFVFTLEVTSGCGNDEYYLARSEHSAADIQIAEILAFGDVLSDSERGQVESYLGAKWGVSVSG